MTTRTYQARTSPIEWVRKAGVFPPLHSEIAICQHPEYGRVRLIRSETSGHVLVGIEEEGERGEVYYQLSPHAIMASFFHGHPGYEEREEPDEA